MKCVCDSKCVCVLLEHGSLGLFCSFVVKLDSF